MHSSANTVLFTLPSCPLRMVMTATRAWVRGGRGRPPELTPAGRACSCGWATRVGGRPRAPGPRRAEEQGGARVRLAHSWASPKAPRGPQPRTIRSALISSVEQASSRDWTAGGPGIPASGTVGGTRDWRVLVASLQSRASLRFLSHNAGVVSPLFSECEAPTPDLIFPAQFRGQGSGSCYPRGNN